MGHRVQSMVSFVHPIKCYHAAEWLPILLKMVCSALKHELTCSPGTCWGMSWSARHWEFISYGIFISLGILVPSGITAVCESGTTLPLMLVKKNILPWCSLSFLIVGMETDLHSKSLRRHVFVTTYRRQNTQNLIFKKTTPT